jgi:hypothetical protein
MRNCDDEACIGSLTNNNEHEFILPRSLLIAKDPTVTDPVIFSPHPAGARNRT